MSATSSLGSLIPTTPTAPLASATYSATPISLAAPTPVEKCNYLRFSRVILIYVILAVIIWIILYLWQPAWVMKADQNGNTASSVDPVSCLIAALVLSLIITLIVVILYWAFSKCRK